MFWGLQLEPTLRYSQQVPRSFRITKAILDGGAEAGTSKSAPHDSGIVQVFIDKDGNEYPIATLKIGHVYDCSLDLRFSSGEDICFFLKGEGTVYLTGHELFEEDDDDGNFSGQVYPELASDESDSFDSDESNDSSVMQGNIDTNEKPASAQAGAKPAAQKANGTLIPVASDDDDDDDEDDKDFDEDEIDEAEFDEEPSDDDDDADEDEDDDDDEEEEEEEEEIVAKTGQKRPSTMANGRTPESKKAKTLPTKETPSKNGQAPPGGKLDGQLKTPKVEKTPKMEKALKAEKPAKTDKTPKIEKTPKAGKESRDVKVKTPGSSEHVSSKEVKIEDLRPGSGPVARKGRVVHVYYTGTLMNGKKFDSVTSGKPFSFKLGTGSVIQGWDQGVEGMKVGGKRRLVIPPRLAYGKSGTGPIPPNATLDFEVELKAVH